MDRGFPGPAANLGTPVGASEVDRQGAAVWQGVKRDSDVSPCVNGLTKKGKSEPETNKPSVFHEDHGSFLYFVPNTTNQLNVDEVSNQKETK